MTEQNSPARHPFEPREADLAAARRQPSELEFPRRLAVVGGGAAVFLSLIVGFFLVWFDIRPLDVLVGLRNIVEHFWAMGFDAIRDIAEYLVAGAAIVVPVWLALRLLNMRARPETERDAKFGARQKSCRIFDSPAGRRRFIISVISV